MNCLIRFNANQKILRAARSFGPRLGTNVVILPAFSIISHSTAPFHSFHPDSDNPYSKHPN